MALFDRLQRVTGTGPRVLGTADVVRRLPSGGGVSGSLSSQSAQRAPLIILECVEPKGAGTLSSITIPPQSER